VNNNDLNKILIDQTKVSRIIPCSTDGN